MELLTTEMWIKRELKTLNLLHIDNASRVSQIVGAST